jgi:hypothetical protein
MYFRSAGFLYHKNPATIFISKTKPEYIAIKPHGQKFRLAAQYMIPQENKNKEERHAGR